MTETNTPSPESMGASSNGPTTATPSQTTAPDPTGTAQSAPAAPAAREAEPPEPTNWVGWIMFGGLVGIMLGIFHIFQGFIAVLRDDYYLVNSDGLAVKVDYTAWGWVHMGIGLLMLLSGAGLLAGYTWARWTTVVFVLISAIINVGFLKAFPIWSVLMIALCVITLWAVVVHGREMKTYADRRSW
jgi:hypothetical protein